MMTPGRGAEASAAGTMKVSPADGDADRRGGRLFSANSRPSQPSFMRKQEPQKACAMGTLARLCARWIPASAGMTASVNTPLAGFVHSSGVGQRVEKPAVEYGGDFFTIGVGRGC